MKACVYRIYDARGELLYIGCSINVFVRSTAHATLKNWWRKVATIKVRHYKTDTAALSAEADAIFNESPKFNRLHAKTNLKQARQGNGAKRPACENLKADVQPTTHLTYQQAADFLKGRGVAVSHKTVRYWGRLKRIKVVDLGHRTKRVTVTSLERMLEQYV